MQLKSGSASWSTPSRLMDAEFRMKLTSYRLDSGPLMSGAAEKPVPGNADVPVIAAGLTRASAALAGRRLPDGLL